MNKIVLVFLFFGSFVFGQKYDVDSLIGISSSLSEQEFRVYIKNYMLIKNQEDVLVFKKENDQWKAAFYKARQNDYKNFTTTKVDLKINDGNNVWLSMLNNHIDKIPKEINIEYKEEKYVFDGKSFQIPYLWGVTDGETYTIIVKNAKNENKIITRSPFSYYYEFPDIDEYAYIGNFLTTIQKELNFTFFDMTKSK